MMKTLAQILISRTLLTPLATAGLACAATLALLLASPTTLHAAESSTPNIIIMMADDLGYGDVSCYGATKIKTPNIDRLAREGMRFTDAHAPSSVCTPTRYGLLTGRYSWRTRLQKGVLGTSHPLLIGKDRMTLASLLKGHGYKTAAIGKWHLGYGTAKLLDWNAPLAPGPLEVGFDYHFGVPQNHNDNSRAFVENHDVVGRKPGEPFRIIPGKAFPEGLAEPRVDDHVDTKLTAKALDFIQENRDRPFFLYFTPCAPHTHVTPAAKFRGTSQAGIYGDYIQELDAHVGEILDRLDQLKLSGKTLVIFTSDNGGGASDFRGGGAAPELKLASDAGGVLEKFRTAKRDASAMGHRNNGALRGAKGDAYEGGHREPFVARWPGRIAAGTVSAETICLTDLLATTASILGVKLPENAGEDSYDILPVLTGKSPETPIRPATVMHGGNGIFSIRSGPWKLVKSDGSEKNATVKSRHDELYNLAEDLAEAKDLAAAHPERVKAMDALLEKIITDGRSTPGAPQKNDVEVRRYPSDGAKEKKPAK